MKGLLSIAVGGAFASLLAILTSQALAQNTNKANPEAKTTEKKSAADKSQPASKKGRAIPFQGHLLEINKTAKTIKVDKRTFEVTHDTKIQRGEKEATLDNGIKGEYVTGSYRKDENGKLIACSIYFGGKNKDKANKEASKSADKN